VLSTGRTKLFDHNPAWRDRMGNTLFRHGVPS
jgi:hypothetical protein